MQRKKKDLTDARREEKKTKPTIRSWVAAKKLRAFLLSYREKKKQVKKKHIFLTMAMEKKMATVARIYEKSICGLSKECAENVHCFTVHLSGWGKKIAGPSNR